MILIVGGAYQGKTAFALRLGQLEEKDLIHGASCCETELFEAKAIGDFHLLIRRMLCEGKEVTGIAKEIEKRNPELIVICNELGCGVVPMDPDDRKWREQTGRICCDLAQRSDQVYRVICGIGTRIK